jgi:hypothetical protein
VLRICNSFAELSGRSVLTLLGTLNLASSNRSDRCFEGKEERAWISQGQLAANPAQNWLAPYRAVMGQAKHESAAFDSSIRQMVEELAAKTPKSP